MTPSPTASAAASESGTLEVSVVLHHAEGLHARPSVSLTKCAKQFAAKIELATSPDGPWIDAKSIVKMMALKSQSCISVHRVMTPSLHSQRSLV